MTELVKIAIGDNVVKDSTLKQYNTQIKKIFEILEIVEPYTETDYYQPILRLKELIYYFQDNKFSKNTKKNYLSILITLSKLQVDLDKGLSHIYYKNKELLHQLFNILKSMLEKNKKENIISKEYINTFLKTQKVNLNDMTDYQNYVILNLFNNLTTVNIKTNFATMVIINDYNKINDFEEDMIVWDDNNKKYYFIIKNFHKKSNRNFKEYFIGGSNTLLHKLLLPLINYRKQNYKGYLFLNKLQKPFTKNNFTQYCKRLFKNIYKKDISINNFCQMFMLEKDLDLEYEMLIEKIIK
tara:strand:- start:425 stop:1315 length:891 start_codon:yes stop_codon:yes gene_type:complete